MNIGREDSLDEQISALQEKVSRAKRLPWTASSSQVEYDQQRLNELQEKKRQKDLQDAKEQAERNYQEQQKRRNAENAALNRMNETEAARHQREIARINAMQYADQAVRDAAIQRENERYEKALASGKKKTREPRNDEATRLLLQYSQQQAQVEGQIAAARQSAGIATERMTEAHKQLLALQQRISDLDGKKLTADEKSVLARKDELIQALTLLDVKQQELQKQTALNELKKKTIQLTSQLAEEERAQRQQHDLDIATVGIGLSMEDTEEGKLSQFLVAANRIAFIDPANGNETPMFVAQGNQIFMNDVFLKRLTAPTITSGGNPPAFSLTSDGKLTAKNADISGSVNANAGTLNNVTVNENCTIKGMLEATQVRGDFVKAVSKSFPKQAGTWGNTETPNGTVTVTISDDHNFDRQIIIPPIIFNGIAYSDPGSGNNPGGTRYTGYGFEVRKNGVLIASRETKGAIPGSYSAVIDMPSGRGSVTLEFKVFHKGNQRAGNITDCTVIVTKKAASGISIR